MVKKIIFVAIFLSLALFFQACAPAVQEGDTIKVWYEGRLDDGTLFDSSDLQGKLLEFTVGGKKVIADFGDAAKGMSVGEEKEFVILPQRGYGEYLPNAVLVIPENPQNPVQAGETITVVSPEGLRQPGKVIKVAEGKVVVDTNHPLAGKTLHFKIRVEEIAGG